MQNLKLPPAANYRWRFNCKVEEGKYQDSIQSSTIPDPEHHVKVTKTHTQESKEIIPFRAGVHMAARNRQDSIAKIKRNINNKKRSTKEAPHWNGQQIESLVNMLNGTNFTLSSDVYQDTHRKVTKTQENTTHKRAKRSAISQQVITRLQGTDKTA